LVLTVHFWAPYFAISTKVPEDSFFLNILVVIVNDLEAYAVGYYFLMENVNDFGENLILF